MICERLRPDQTITLTDYTKNQADQIPTLCKISCHTLGFCQDLADGNFTAAVENIREFRGKEKNMISMVEVLLAKLITSKEDFQQTLATFLEVTEKILKATTEETSATLPEELVDNIQLLSRLASCDLKGEETFDILLQLVEQKSSDPGIRVVLNQKHGKEMVARVKAANVSLQSRFSKSMSIAALKVKVASGESNDSAVIIEVMEQCAGLDLSPDDLKVESISQDHQLICTRFINLCKATLAECETSMKNSVACFKADSKICFLASAQFFASETPKLLQALFGLQQKVIEPLFLDAIAKRSGFNPIHMECMAFLVAWCFKVLNVFLMVKASGYAKVGTKTHTVEECMGKKHLQIQIQ